MGKLDGSMTFPVLDENASSEEAASAIASSFLSAAAIMKPASDRLIGALPGDPTAEFKRILAEDSASIAADLLDLATLTPHNPTPIEIEACAAALDKVGEKGDDARAGLLEALRRHLDAWKGTVGDTLDELEDCAILPLDEALARYMAAELGEPGEQTAGLIREAAAKRMDAYTGEAQQIEALSDIRAVWKLWALPAVGAPLVRGLSLLARVAWDHKVRGEVERERKERGKRATGLTYPLFGQVAEMNRPGAVVIEGEVLRLISSTAARAEIRAQLGATEETAARAIEALGKVPYRLTLRKLMDTANRDYWEGRERAGRFTFDGGAALAGFVLGKDPRDCRDVGSEYENVARALLMTFPNPHDPEHWVSLAGGEVRPGRGRRPGHISLVLTDPAMPTYLYSLPSKGARAREARRLVPLTDAPATHPKGNRVKGPQLWFWDRLVARIRDRAAEAYVKKGVKLPPSELERAAAAAGLAKKWARPLVKLWVKSGDLVEPSTGRYHIGPNHTEARTSIDWYGRKEENGRNKIPPPEKQAKRSKTRGN